MSLRSLLRPLPHLALPVVAAIATGPALASDGNVDVIPPTVYAGVGPLGAGVGLAWRGPGDVSARLLLHSGSLAAHRRDDVDLQGIDYDMRQRFGPGVSLLLDYRPWHATGWRLTGGAVVSRLNTTLAGRPDRAGQYTINGRAYSVAEVGLLEGRLRYKPVNPYLGGGWESRPAGTPGWRFACDFGALLMARPGVTLTGSAASGNTALQQDLAAEQRELRRHGVAVLGSVGVAYGF